MENIDQGPISGINAQPAADTGATPATPTQDASSVAGQAPSQTSGAEGQAPAEQPTSPQQGEVPSFFDPKILGEHPELIPLYKQMQAAFTKKTQEVAPVRKLMEQYKSDPIGTLQQLAAQHGHSLTRAEARQQIQEQQQAQVPEDWTPKTWREVLDKAKEVTRSEVRNEILQELSPYLQNVQRLQAGNIESQLNQIDSNWRMYEDDMRKNLAEHPTLVKDVAKLYRMSVPDEVYSAKHVQAALTKLQGKVSGSKVGSTSSASQSTPAPKKVSSFDEAVQAARESLSQRGR